jgi:hypothetical protein
MTLRLLSRAGCGLCDEAAAELRSLGAAFEVVDIDSDPRLRSLYNDCIPVVMLDGREIARAPIAAGTLRPLLAALEEAHRVS